MFDLNVYDTTVIKHALEKLIERHKGLTLLSVQAEATLDKLTEQEQILNNQGANNNDK